MSKKENRENDTIRSPGWSRSNDSFFHPHPRLYLCIVFAYTVAFFAIATG